MSLLVKCDVRDCNTADRIESTMGSVPIGWRVVMETRMQRPVEAPEQSQAAFAMGEAIAEKFGLPKELIEASRSTFAESPGFAIPVTFHICPLHDLPPLIQMDGVPPPAPLHDRSDGGAR